MTLSSLARMSAKRSILSATAVSCCCEALLAIRRFGVPTICSNFITIVVNRESCIGCGKCEKICPVDAIEIIGEGAEEGRGR